MFRRYRLQFLVLAAITVFGLLPLIAAIAAGLAAAALGCQLHEGYAVPCLSGGYDIGPFLYQLAVLGWLALVTIPLAVLSGIPWLVWFTICVRRTPGR